MVLKPPCAEGAPPRSEAWAKSEAWGGWGRCGQSMRCVLMRRPCSPMPFSAPSTPCTSSGFQHLGGKAEASATHSSSTERRGTGSEQPWHKPPQSWDGGGGGVSQPLLGLQLPQLAQDSAHRSEGKTDLRSMVRWRVQDGVATRRPHTVAQWLQNGT